MPPFRLDGRVALDIYQRFPVDTLRSLHCSLNTFRHILPNSMRAALYAHRLLFAVCRFSHGYLIHRGIDGFDHFVHVMRLCAFPNRCSHARYFQAFGTAQIPNICLPPPPNRYCVALQHLCALLVVYFHSFTQTPHTILFLCLQAFLIFSSLWFY